jgi:hypothetical protein
MRATQFAAFCYFLRETGRELPAAAVDPIAYVDFFRDPVSVRSCQRLH